MDTDLLLTFLVIVIISSRAYVLNFIGYVLGYGNCPSCGNSWLWNGAGSIEYTTLEKGKGIIVSIKMHKNIMICERCLENPNKIDSAKIKHNLIKLGLGSCDVESIVYAIEKLKREDRL